MASRPFHLGWFLANTYGVHGWEHPWGGTTARDWTSPELHIDLARALERACVDLLLLEDSSFVPDTWNGSSEFYLSRALRAPKNDPLPLVPLLTHATTRLGIVPTISTSFYPPFLLARLIATLDHMSAGRVGCNFVTSTSTRAAQNFGLDNLVDHDTRYEMADEFIEVVSRLWASWDEDAIVADPETHVYADHRKVHPIDFKGRHFASRGPLNTARPPQGRPLLVQAGMSPKGREFAARNMDLVVGAASTPAEMKAFRDDIRARAAAAGRDPDSCKVMFYFVPTLGETREEAEARYERLRQAQRATPETMLAMIGSLTDIDFAGLDLDAPLGELKTNGQQGTLKQFLSKGRTLREIADNYIFGLEHLAGTSEEVAKAMGEIMEEVGGDGFMISGPLSRRYVAEVTDGLVPALQRAGLVRTAYTHAHLRDNLMEF